MSTDTISPARSWLDALLERWSERDLDRAEGAVEGPGRSTDGAEAEAEDGSPRAEAGLEIEAAPGTSGTYALLAGAEGDEAFAFAEVSLSTDPDPEPELAMTSFAGRLPAQDGGSVQVASLSLSMTGGDASASIDGSAEGFRFAIGLGGSGDDPLG